MPIFDLEKNKAIRLGIFGSSNKGKSFRATSLFTTEDLLMGKFDEIFLIHPEYEAEDDGQNWKMLEINHIYIEFSQELVGNICDYVRMKNKKNRDYRACLIMDDCVAFGDFGTINKRTELDKAFSNSRKTGLSLILLSQAITYVPKNVRNQMTHLIIFHTTFGDELETIDKKFRLTRDKHKWSDIWEYVYKEKYDFMLLDTEEQIIYRNFNRLTYD